MTTLHGYHAFPGYLEELARELRLAGIKPRKMERHASLILVEGFKRKPVWASNVWGSVERIKFESIADGIRALKALGLKWSLSPNLFHRRAQLILKGLSATRFPPLVFPADPLPSRKLGSFMLISENELLASAHCSQTLPQGEIVFAEPRDPPPTRAFLKLWEVFTRLGSRPGVGDSCVDLGSCPGGWTWVLAQLGTQVVSVDRSEIAPEVLALPGVRFVQGNAFSQDPRAFGKLDWVFSDLICEPPKLVELVRRWQVAHPEASFVCSVKFKGETDFKALHALLAIRGSTAVHLYHNKNEVTWVRLSAARASSAR